VWKYYVDTLSKALLAQSDKARLLQHRGLAGSARETYVNEFLRRMLPESLGLGTGEIFDRSGTRSRQMDVIVYDRGFPIPQIDNRLSLFPIESVVAAIEVKPNLDQSILFDALEKCLSVTRMRVVGCKVTPLQKESQSDAPPSKRDFDFLYPGTYVVAFEGFRSGHAALAKSTISWVQKEEATMHYLAAGRLVLPRVISTPTALLLREVDDLELHSDDGPRPSDPGFRFLSAASENAYQVFVVDLLSKLLTRTNFVRFQSSGGQLWDVSDAESFRVEDLLSYAANGTVGTISPPGT